MSEPPKRPDDLQVQAFACQRQRVSNLKNELDQARNELECMEINCKHLYADGSSALYEGWVFNFCDVCGAAKGLNKTQFPNATGLAENRKKG